MKNFGHIAIGGDDGSLRVLQLPNEGGKRADNLHTNIMLKTRLGF